MNLRQLTMSQLSELTGIDRRTIKKRLADAGLEPVAQNVNMSLYETEKALPLLYKIKTNKIEEELAVESLRLEKAKADKMELELAKIRGEQVDVEDVSKVVQQEYTYVRAQLLAIPSNLATPLANESEPEKVKVILDEAIAEALSELQADIYYEERAQDVIEQSPSTEATEGSSEHPETTNETQSS